jgi:hypothetical protein
MPYRLALLSLCFATAAAGAQPPKSSSLAVETKSGWHTWWRSETAPSSWTRADPVLSAAVKWKEARRGVDHAELRLAGTGEAWRIRLVMLRIDPRVVRTELVRMTREYGTLPAWSIDSIPPRAIAGFNAGQFESAVPWGWIVRNGIEEQSPGFGPLSSAMVVDSSGNIQLVPFEAIPSLRGRVVTAFQSYPSLLVDDGAVPVQLREAGSGVDLNHRDTRLAIGMLRDGRMLVVLTRFEGLGGILSELPFGPTIPEMSAIMGALGAASSVALDGGISGQLFVRASPRPRLWKGLRRVPMGLVVYPAA